MGLAILGPLRDLDEVAYLRFARVYRGFESLDDFEKAITELRGRHLAEVGRDDGDIDVPRARRLTGAAGALPGRRGRKPEDCHGASEADGRRCRTVSLTLPAMNHRCMNTITLKRRCETDPGIREEGGMGVMTETASGPAARKGKRGKGLKIRRINTTPGVHPYDQVTWERRDVVMTNWRDGSINFEQRGVEFPDFWSVNAGNIVTTKYFRGAVGTPQREWSLKQLVDRVVERLHVHRPGARLLRLATRTRRSSTTSSSTR